MKPLIATLCAAALFVWFFAVAFYQTAIVGLSREEIDAQAWEE